MSTKQTKTINVPLETLESTSSQNLLGFIEH